MTDAIPLFPLGTVLFPGVVLPLHIFEPRYRHLVRDLVAPEAEGRREFGVVGIRQGWEVGTDGVKAMYAVGCTAELRQVQPYDDGRFDIVTVGRRRFRLHSMDTATRPYLSGDVEWLPDDVGNPDEADVLARGVGEIFARCRRMLRSLQTPKSALPTKEPPEEDPDDELAAPGIAQAAIAGKHRRGLGVQGSIPRGVQHQAPSPLISPSLAPSIGIRICMASARSNPVGRAITNVPFR